MTEIINTKIFANKVQGYLDAGVKRIILSESDDKFAEWVDSGFYSYLMNNYEHYFNEATQMHFFKIQG